MVAGICMCKDEIDVIETTIRHMAAHCDVVYVWDNGSTDGTRELLDTLPCVVEDDPEPGYYQSAKMSAHAEHARVQGAEWIVPFDADEIWQCNGRVRDVLSQLHESVLICEATIVDHVATPGYEFPSPWRRSQVLPLRKVACRAVEGLRIHQGNHGADFGLKSMQTLRVADVLEIRHFPYRSPEQFITKARNGAAAYAATDLPEDAGAHWRGYGRMSDEDLRDWFHRWFFSANPEEELVHDPASIRCARK